MTVIISTLTPEQLEKATARELFARLAPVHEADLHSVVAVDRMVAMLRIRCSCDCDIVFLEGDVVAATGRTTKEVHDRLVDLGRGPERFV